MSQDDVCVIIPAFNEATALTAVLKDLQGRDDWEIVVVDDGSTDATARVAAERGCTVLRHAINLGQGAALETGFEYARRKGSRVAVTFDADGQHRAEDVPLLVDPILRGEVDVVLGSRFLPAAEDEEPRPRPPLGRRIGLRIAVWGERLATHLPVTDAHCGLRALSRSALERISLTQTRMAHASEILRQIADRGIRWREVPVRIDYTAYSMKKGQRWWQGALTVIDLIFGRFRV